ncbi:hypothetical protein BpHYR1_023827 [Brachionus plicatilis]|uniref:Uncharacterized protein n=1 Tax=Brachionus plicatilis TaxID=10195 RepID=A0A3M7PQU9_BRAPC|nr:hypothetical protein BpHYR1_023827 [Brachionus plicatilis]
MKRKKKNIMILEKLTSNFYLNKLRNFMKRKSFTKIGENQHTPFKSIENKTELICPYFADFHSRRILGFFRMAYAFSIKFSTPWYIVMFNINLPSFPKPIYNFKKDFNLIFDDELSSFELSVRKQNWSK